MLNNILFIDNKNANIILLTMINSRIYQSLMLQEWQRGIRDTWDNEKHRKASEIENKKNA